MATAPPTPAVPQSTVDRAARRAAEAFGLAGDAGGGLVGAHTCKLRSVDDAAAAVAAAADGRGALAKQSISGGLLSAGKLYVFAGGHLCYKGGLGSSTRSVIAVADLEDVLLDDECNDMMLVAAGVCYALHFSPPGGRARRDSARRSVMAVWSAQLASVRSRRQSDADPEAAATAVRNVAAELTEVASALSDDSRGNRGAAQQPSPAEACGGTDGGGSGSNGVSETAARGGHVGDSPNTPRRANGAGGTARESGHVGDLPNSPRTSRTPEAGGTPRKEFHHARMPSNLSALTLESMDDFRMSVSSMPLDRKSTCGSDAGDATGAGGGEDATREGEGAVANGEEQTGRGGEERELPVQRSEEAEQPSLYAQNDDIDASDEEVDPRVGEALEALNEATDEVNRLENDLSGARRSYARVKRAGASRVNDLVSKLEPHIRAAAPYYNALELVRERRERAAKAATRFTDALVAHEEARAELHKVESALESGAAFDPYMQDRMGRCGEAVTRSAAAREVADVDHVRAADECEAALAQLDAFSRRVKKHALLAKPYFDARAAVEVECASGLKHCEGLAEQVEAAKARVGDALQMLDTISRDVHAKRSGEILEVPGGAENGDGDGSSNGKDVMCEAEAALERYKILTLPVIERRKSIIAAAKEAVALVAAADAEDDADLPPIVSIEQMLGKKLSLVVEETCDLEAPDTPASAGSDHIEAERTLATEDGAGVPSKTSEDLIASSADIAAEADEDEADVDDLPEQTTGADASSGLLTEREAADTDDVSKIDFAEPATSPGSEEHDAAETCEGTDTGAAIEPVADSTNDSADATEAMEETEDTAETAANAVEGTPQAP